MVVKETIEILISKDGQLKMTVKGIRGQGCEKIIRKIKEVVVPGSVVLEQGRTWEYNLSEAGESENLRVSNTGDERKP